MDFQFWVWLIIIILTFLARAGRKKKVEDIPTAESRERRPYNPPPASEPKPLTFEELLREIQSSRDPQPKKPEPVFQEVDYDENIEEEEKGLETVEDAGRGDKVYDVYEKAKQEAFARPSLEETVKLEDTVVRFGQFRGYQVAVEKGPFDEYLRDLRDPQGFKKAFILSEILQRRF